jgi:hypothetical protein
MASDETTFQRQWKITVAICLAYGAVLSVVFGLILYDLIVAGRLAGLTQARSEGWTMTVIMHPREADQADPTFVITTKQKRTE